MKIYLASPNTILRFKDGVEIMRVYLAGGGNRKFKCRMEKGGKNGDYP